MDVIGFELFLKPLGSVLSESGAIAQLVQGMYMPRKLQYAFTSSTVRLMTNPRRRRIVNINLLLLYTRQQPRDSAMRLYILDPGAAA